MESLRALSFGTGLFYITGRVAVDDKVVWCVCGVIILCNKAHSMLKHVELVVSEVMLESNTTTN